jgi:hypothetical protein
MPHLAPALPHHLAWFALEKRGMMAAYGVRVKAVCGRSFYI